MLVKARKLEPENCSDGERHGKKLMKSGNWWIVWWNDVDMLLFLLFYV